MLMQTNVHKIRFVVANANKTHLGNHTMADEGQRITDLLPHDDGSVETNDDGWAICRESTEMSVSIKINRP